MKLEIFTDGGCSGNPGPAAIGVVIRIGTKTVKTISRFIGQGTNNIAEYTAFKLGIVTYGADNKTFPVGTHREIQHNGKYYKFTPVDVEVKYDVQVKKTKYFLGFIPAGTELVTEHRIIKSRFVRKEIVSDKIEVDKIIKAQQNNK